MTEAMPPTDLGAWSVQNLTAKLRAVTPLHLLSSPRWLDEVAARWCERQRVWHGPGHLLELIRRIEENAPTAERELLLLVALYHDAIYDPRAADNEEASAALLQSHAA